MPQQGVQRIEFEGQVHEFPSDFTDADIQKALSSYGKTPQASPSMPSGNFPIPKPGLMGQEQITSQQPTGPLALSRNTPLKTFQGQAQGRVADAQQQGLRGEISPLESGLETFTGGSLSDIAGLAGQPMESVKNAALTAGAFVPYLRAALSPYFMYQGGKMALTPQQTGENQADYLQRALLGGSMAAGGAAQAASSVKTGITGVKNFRADKATANQVQDIAGSEATAFSDALRTVSHDSLTQEMKSGKQKLYDAQNGVSRRVGELKKDMVATSVGSSPDEPPISISDLWPKMEDLATRFKAAGGRLPKFDAAVDAIGKRQGEMGLPKHALTLDEAFNLRTEIGDLWAKAASSPRDASAVKELQNTITDKIQQHVDDIGHTKTFGAYNKVWSTLQQYKSGALGDLLNAPYGKDFFDVLTDPKRSSDLARAFNDLEKFGLKKNFKADLLKTSAKSYEYVKSDPNSFSKYRAIMRHPVVAGAAWAAGSHVGGFLGGGMSAIKAAELADAIEGVRALRQTGIPSRAGAMGEAADVMPSGASPEDAEFDARVKQAAAMRNAVKPTSPPTQSAGKPIYEMSPEELDAGYKTSQTSDASMVKEFFGEEGAKRYEQLQRKANSTTRPFSETNAASDEIERMESELSEAQRDRLYGRGETGPAPDDFREYRDALRRVGGDTPEDLGDSMKWAITRMGEVRDPATMTPEQQLAYAQLRRGFEIADSMGWDKNAVYKSALKGAHARFEPNDADTMLRQFKKPTTKQDKAASIKRLKGRGED